MRDVSVASDFTRLQKGEQLEKLIYTSHKVCYVKWDFLE